MVWCCRATCSRAETVAASIVSVTLPLVQGVVLLIALAYIATNLLVDLVYGFLDPRIRYR